MEPTPILVAILSLALGVSTDETDPTIESIPINGEQGLADVRVVPPDAWREAGHVELWFERRDDPGTTRSVPLRRDDDGSWNARIWAGASPTADDGTDIQFTIRFDLPEGSGTSGPHAISCAPDPDASVPDWALGAVWYQIFPERFRNGNPLNDPSYPGIYRPAWTSDWHSVAGEELEAAQIGAVAGRYALDPEQQGGMLYNVVWHRRYGGDLQGVVERLDYLQELGVTALYFTPIFDSLSMHKYDAADFRHIDPTLGHPGEAPGEHEHDPRERIDPETWRWTPADRYFLDVLLPAARERGMRVILDGVWNHTGREFWGFEDLQRNGSWSPFSEWFYARFEEDESESDGVARAMVGWRAWDKENGYLPKFRQTPRGDLVEPVKAHVFDVTERWMDPNGDGDPSDGIDGWRLDVAPEIGFDFWEDWREHVRSINPDALLVGEIWFDAREYFGGRAFDAQMNYPFAFAVVNWCGMRPGMTSQELGDALRDVFSHDPQNDLVQMNLVDSHDVERIASMMDNPGRSYDQGARIFDSARGYQAGPPSDEAWARANLALAIQATWLGSPMIYYGNELGMYGPDDPDNRKPVPWDDLAPYDNPDEGARDDVLAHYRRWLSLRHDERIGPVLRFGSARPIGTGDDDVFAFERTLNGERVLVVINRSGRSFDASAMAGDLERLWGGDGVIAPWSGAVWREGER